MGNANCELDVNAKEQNILRFVEAVERDKNLELLGTNADVIIAEDGIKKYHIDELFVLRDKRYNEEDSRAFPKVEIEEVAEKCTPLAHAEAVSRPEQMVKMAKGDGNSVLLLGITRIVGYYSRVNGWNKSKVGELRDRAHDSYKLTDKEPKHLDSRHKYINSLS